MALPLVSIIIPCYNSEQYIAETMQSVLDQTYKNVEIIVVDDASTDGTLKELDRFKNHIELIKFKENRFVCEARMSGVSKANGEYILFLDSDDLIHKTFLEKCVAVLENNPSIDVCYTKVKFFGAKNHEWKLPNFDSQGFLLANCVVMTSLIRKTAYDKTDGFDTSLKMFVDWELFISIFKNGSKFYRIDEVLFYYRKRKVKTSITDGANRNPKAVSDNYLKIYLKHYDFYIENGIYFQDMMAFKQYKDKYYNQWFKKLFYTFKKKK